MTRTLHGALGWVVVVLLASLWEAVAHARILEPVFFPAASVILMTFGKLLVTGVLPYHIGMSLLNMFSGYFLSALIAVPFGVLLGHHRALYNLFEPAIEALRPLPTTAIVPLAMLFLGVGAVEKIFLIFFACSRIMIVNAVYGARSADPRLIETARVYGYSGFQLARRIVFPAATPHIMTGLRISLAISVIVIISAEILGSDKGIGYYTILQQRNFSTPEMYAGVLSLCVLGYLLNRLFVLVESVLMGWHQGLTASRR